MCPPGPSTSVLPNSGARWRTIVLQAVSFIENAFSLRIIDQDYSITTPNHQARKIFLDDVKSTYDRIKTRTAELAAERAKESQVEQIQLQAVDPGTEIYINVPQPNSTEQVEQQARVIFETFPPGFQRALESGNLDRVNEVLGKMGVEEAEEIVGQLGENGMLDMRQGVIDGTTEEGKEQIRKMKDLEIAEEAMNTTAVEGEPGPEVMKTADPE